MIIVGAGHLGQALANYTNFRKRGFIVKAIFDKDPSIIGNMVGEIQIQPMEKLESVIKENDIKMAAVCIPKGPAIKVVEQLIDAGIVGIWNFAHVDLDVPDNIVIENVHLSESLMRLSYRMGEALED
jgi:redox-sensing transcriptional repressor